MNLFLSISLMGLLGDPNQVYLLKWGAVLVAAFLVLFFLQHLIRRSVQKRSSRIAEEEARLLKLDALKKRGLVSDDELRRVREAMARKYIERQAEAAKAPEPKKGFSALEQLAVEAERLDAQLPSPEGTELPPVPPPEIGSVVLPPRLENLLRVPETEWDDMRNAGFLSDEDVVLLRRARDQEERR